MDLFTMNALAKELNDALSGAKTEKIVQPENDEIRFYLRNGNRNYILVVSANAKVPRIHLTAQNSLYIFQNTNLRSQHLDESEKNALEEEIPAGRFGDPQEVAQLVESLVNMNSYLTGQIITLDGGWI